ncbi:hypothetical protein R3P38DRAFT_1878780 [Favolaschia claudopus]|uniref:Uncharacterized protein n=1 Tax=Favolaschia claudopus TaxID=2862362 RepID=A0AAW0DBW1_9AGAR
MYSRGKKQSKRSTRQVNRSESSSSGSLSAATISSNTPAPAPSSLDSISAPSFSFPPPSLPSGSFHSVSEPHPTPLEFFSFPPPQVSSHHSPSSILQSESTPSHSRDFVPYEPQFSYPPPRMASDGFYPPWAATVETEPGSIDPSTPWNPSPETYRTPSSSLYLPPGASSSNPDFAPTSSTAQSHLHLDDYFDGSSSSDDEDDDEDDTWYFPHYAADPSMLHQSRDPDVSQWSSDPSSSASTSRLPIDRSSPIVIETIPSREQLTQERAMRKRQSRSVKMYPCKICHKEFPR